MFLRALILCACATGAIAQIATVRKGFTHPPDDARIMVRWWWFGPAVTKPELERELRTMKEGGIGGVEIQPVYPLVLDDPARGARNLPYLSDDFIDAVRFAAQKARELGLRVDITLGSGWPYGGPHVPITEAAGRLRIAHPHPPPSLENGEQVISTSGDTAFIASRTGQQVKRAAVNAEGFVLDHYDRAAIEHHLRVVGDRLMQAFGDHPPYAVFSDSLEVYGSDWTADLPEQFRKRRGYDLIPLLPALIGDIGPKTADVRRDWGQTLTELAEERYLTPIREWAHRHGTRFRSQSYGIPPVILSSNALVDLPEGEGSQWRTFTATRWASSASHLYGRPVTSSETWTWLHSPAFRATPLDMKAEADLHFLEGINQLVGHGWPYSPPEAGEPGWSFYAAAVFNNHNPWWIVMPEITKYLQRASFVLRQGKPANDVALYLPTEDAWAHFTPGHDSVNQLMGGLLGPTLIPQILDDGFNLDFIDDRAIAQVGIPYPVVVLPAFQRMPEATAHKLEEFKKRGGIVVDAAHIADLPLRYPPDFATGDAAVGFVHRKLDDADIYFIANTSNHAVHTKAQVRIKGRRAEWWDPFTAHIEPAGANPIELDLAPYESRVLVFSNDAEAQPPPVRHNSDVIDISSDWKVDFPALHRTVEMHELHSWPDDEATKFFSGIATYEKTIERPRGNKVLLNFGEGTAVPQQPLANGMRAWLESPVHEAAMVFINGERAGAVWRPPYEIDITKLLKPGANMIRIEVANLAINELAGQSPPDYRLLKLRYGDRFQPQDMKNLKPLPAGITGPIRLLTL